MLVIVETLKERERIGALLSDQLKSLIERYGLPIQPVIYERRRLSQASSVPELLETVTINAAEVRSSSEQHADAARLLKEVVRDVPAPVLRAFGAVIQAKFEYAPKVRMPRRRARKRSRRWSGRRFARVGAAREIPPSGRRHGGEHRD